MSRYSRKAKGDGERMLVGMCMDAEGRVKLVRRVDAKDALVLMEEGARLLREHSPAAVALRQATRLQRFVAWLALRTPVGRWLIERRFKNEPKLAPAPAPEVH